MRGVPNRLSGEGGSIFQRSKVDPSTALQPLEIELPRPPDRLRGRPDMQNTLESSYLTTRNDMKHTSEGASGVLARTKKSSDP